MAPRRVMTLTPYDTQGLVALVECTAIPASIYHQYDLLRYGLQRCVGDMFGRTAIL